MFYFVIEICRIFWTVINQKVVSFQVRAMEQRLLEWPPCGEGPAERKAIVRLEGQVEEQVGRLSYFTPVFS